MDPVLEIDTFVFFLFIFSSFVLLTELKTWRNRRYMCATTSWIPRIFYCTVHIFRRMLLDDRASTIKFKWPECQWRRFLSSNSGHLRAFLACRKYSKKIGRKNRRVRTSSFGVRTPRVHRRNTNTTVHLSPIVWVRVFSSPDEEPLILVVALPVL